jgi:DsbC/DsbD-like thiol-disulfide interchange protein
MKHTAPALFCAFLSAAAPATAEVPAPVASAEILGGWLEGSGQHIAAVRITLAPGWKTYWRAPGDAGIPPEFDWGASRNVAAVTPLWPVPHVFWQNGMRSVGYADSLVLPLVVTPEDSGQPIRLAGRVDIGVCEEICVPVSLDLAGDLPAPGAPDPDIAAALAARPVPAASAGVASVTCTVEPIADGIRLTASVVMPAIGADEAAILELADPTIWISEAETRRDGGILHATAEMVPPNARPFAIDRSEVRITVLSGARGVDIQGCAGG